MFTLLTQFLTEEQQASILSDAIERRGKGLIAPQPFLELPLDTIIQSVILKVMEYKNSYAEARLAKLGLSIPASIWCDRATDLAIFLRGIARDIPEFDSALLCKYPLISQEELSVQTGGLKLGYWHLFAQVEATKGISKETLWEIAEAVKPFLLTAEKPEENEEFSFSQELNNYIHAKNRKKRGKKTICAITGQAASELSSAGSPYKVQCYSNRRTLGSTALVSQVSSQWQKELALRSVLWGKDEKHEKVWIYANSNILDTNLPIGFMTPIHAIRTACEAVVNGGQVLISPSAMPHEISQSYEIELFPDWLIHFGCKSSGNQGDAEHILKVLKIFGRLHNVKALGNYEESVSIHGRKAMSDPLYLPHILPKESEANIRYIQKALEVLKI